MEKIEKLKKLKELEILYDDEIRSLIKEVAMREANFKKHSEEVKKNGKKSDRRMNLAGCLLSFGTLLSTTVIPLSRGNIFACIFAFGFLAYAGINGVIAWRKADKCDKKIKELDILETQNYNKCLELREKIAIIEQKKFKVKYQIEKLTKEEKTYVHTINSNKPIITKTDIKNVDVTK